MENDFYKMLSKYYDKLFPFDEDTYNFLKSFTKKGDKILDIGSATGSYIKQFEKEGYDVTGLEFSKDFIRDYNLLIGDMHNLPFKSGSFDFIYCIGNTLAHAKSRGDFSKIVTSSLELLKPKGVFLFQILNYDRILDNEIKRLPDIVVEDIIFERYYEYENQSKIEFKGVLKHSDTQYKSKTTLIPITLEEIKWVAGKSKVNFVQFFGDFSGKKFFKPESFMLISVFHK